MHETDISIFVRLFVAIICSGVIGWERESAGKAAGLRTHILVGVSSVLFVVLGEYFTTRVTTNVEYLRFDPVRVIEAIVTGISFLGAGMILRDRGRIKGLTTAASILATAAISIAVGVERYVLAAGSTAIVFVVLYLVNIIESRALAASSADRGE